MKTSSSLWLIVRLPCVVTAGSVLTAIPCAVYYCSTLKVANLWKASRSKWVLTTLHTLVRGAVYIPRGNRNIDSPVNNGVWDVIFT
jgi:hypothetical protein